MTFDQKEIVSEAEAFAAFVEELGPAYGVDPARTGFIGWSNGGNMIAAVMQLHPGTIEKAVILRSMNCLEAEPKVDLSSAHVLSLSATDDFYGDLAQEVERRLAAAGADLTAKKLYTNHGIGREDEAIARDWLEGLIG